MEKSGKVNIIAKSPFNGERCVVAVSVLCVEYKDNNCTSNIQLTQGKIKPFALLSFRGAVSRTLSQLPSSRVSCIVVSGALVAQ